VEKPKTVKERVIEEHIKGMESPLIARLLNVSNNFVTKVLYLYKQSESVIIRPPEPKLNEEEVGLGVIDTGPPVTYNSEGNRIEPEAPIDRKHGIHQKGDPFPSNGHPIIKPEYQTEETEKEGENK
ncbi:hypothetical protein LCGC14_2092180, partial [marine sediment metagenome]